MLLHGALSTGLAQARDVMQSAVDDWSKILTNEVGDGMDRVAAVYGLTSAFGCNRFIFQFDELDIFDPSLKNKLADFIKTIQQIIQSSEDTILCLNCSRLLGLLHMVHYGNASHQANLPSNYNYLPDASLLRASFNSLVEAGKTGPLGTYSSPAVKSIVSGLIAPSATTLPPVNWALVLSPLMKLGFGQETRRLCLSFAILNASSSVTLPTWLISWMNPSVFQTLEDGCKEEIINNLDSIIRIVPIQHLKMILEELPAQAYNYEEENKKLQECILLSLKRVAEVKNPIQSSLLHVRHALEKIATHKDVFQQDTEALKHIADCLLSLPAELMAGFMKNIQANHDLSLAIASMMVAHHGSSLKVLTKSLDWLLTNPDCLSSRCLQLMKYAVQRHFLNSSTAEAQEEEVVWFLDQIGKSKKIAAEKETVTALHSLLELLSSSVAVWSMAGISLPDLRKSETAQTHEAAFLSTFGNNLAILVQQPRWLHLQRKIVEWLIGMLESLGRDKNCIEIRTLVQSSLICLRHTETWKTHGIWTKSFDLIE